MLDLQTLSARPDGYDTSRKAIAHEFRVAMDRWLYGGVMVGVVLGLLSGIFVPNLPTLWTRVILGIGIALPVVFASPIMFLLRRYISYRTGSSDQIKLVVQHLIGAHYTAKETKVIEKRAEIDSTIVSIRMAFTLLALPFLFSAVQVLMNGDIWAWVVMVLATELFAFLLLLDIEQATTAATIRHGVARYNSFLERLDKDQ